MEHRSVFGLVLLLTVALIFLALACSGSDNNNNRVDDETDDDDDNDDNDDNDNDDNDDNDDDTADDFPIQLVDGGAPGRNGVSMVRSADGTFHLAAVRGYSLIVYSWQDKDIAEEKVFTPAAEPILRQDADGNLCVVFLDPFEHVLRYADNRTGKWVTEAIQEHIADLETYSFALDANGKACVAYYDSTSVKILFATNRSGSWAMTAVGDAAPAPSGTAIGVDAAGAVHVAYDGSPAGSLYYATNASGSWVTELVTANGYAPAMALDSAGRPRLIYRVPVEWSGSRLDYAVRDAGEWQVETAGEAKSWNYYHYDLVLDSAEKVHISSHLLEGTPYGSTGDLYYLTNQGGEWIEEEIDSYIQSFYGQFTSIVLDENDFPTIGYYTPINGGLKTVVKILDLWTYLLIDTTGFTSQGKLFVNKVGQAFIDYLFWYDNIYMLKVTNNTSSSWLNETVKSLSTNIFNHAIAVDSSDHFHLAFNNDSSHSVQYADNSAGFWNVQTVESNDEESLFVSSLALDGQENSHLCYYTNQAGFRYATNRSGNWDIQSIYTDTAFCEAINVDSADNVHVALSNYYGKGIYATDRTGNWVLEAFDDAAINPEVISFVLDVDDFAHIAYRSFDKPYQFKYATNKSGTWTAAEISSDKYILTGTLALDADKNINIAYYSSSEDPCGYFLADNSSGKWVVRQLAGCDNVGNDYVNVSLAIDEAGLIHAAYDFEGGLFYRTFNPSR